MGPNSGQAAVSYASLSSIFTSHPQQCDVPETSLPPGIIQSNHAFSHHNSLRSPSRATSKTPTDPGPSSARSNMGTPIRRPIRRSQLEPKGISEQSFLHSKHIAGVQKSKENLLARYHKPSSTAADSTQHLEPEMSLLKVNNTLSQYKHDKQREMKQKQRPIVSSFREFVDRAHLLEEMLEEYQSRVDLAQSQEEEIKRLNHSEDESQKKLEAMEGEKRILSQKLKKYKTFHAQYTDHMNRVVNSQKMLIDEAKEMRKASDEAIKAYAANQAAVDQIDFKLKEIRGMRLQADELVKKEQAMLDRVNIAEKTANEFKAGEFRSRMYKCWLTL